MSESQPLLSNRTLPGKSGNFGKGLLTVAVLAITIVVGYTLSDLYKEIDLAKTVSASGALVHLKQLEIAAAASTADGKVPNRSVGSKGYDATVEYFVEQLKEHTDYEITVQPFIVPLYRQELLEFEFFGPDRKAVIDNKASVIYPYESYENFGITVKRFEGTRYCDPEQWKNTESSAAYHVVATASAVRTCGTNIFYSQLGVVGLFLTIVDDSNLVDLDVWSAREAEEALTKSMKAELYRFSILNDGIKPMASWPEFLIMAPQNSWLGESLTSYVSPTTSAFLRLSRTGQIENVETYNVLAETPGGDENSVVLVGAHLDGVEYGSGINDDGSGSAALLEIALQLYSTGLSKHVVNKVRFGWWAAEEEGRLGSIFYAENLLAKKELGKIALNLNHDMVGSPNGSPGIHDGTTYTANTTLSSPNVKIQKVYTNYFENRLPGKNYELRPLHMGSDHFSFLQVGVPAGGVETGAGRIKTIEQQKRFGVANEPMDPCYHQYCDTYLAYKPNLLQWLWE